MLESARAVPRMSDMGQVLPLAKSVRAGGD